jgi:hypothetical protein
MRRGAIMEKAMALRRRIGALVRRDDGTQIVEMAIVLPVMVVLLAAGTEFGRFFYTYATLTNACRAGARHACKWKRTASWVTPETSNIVVYGDFADTSKGPILPGLTVNNVEIDANGPSPNNIDSVTVKIINYKYQPLFDLGALVGNPSLSLNIDMNANATMHQLFNGPVAGE